MGEMDWKGRWSGSLSLTLIPSNLIFNVVCHRVVVTLNVIQH